MGTVESYKTGVLVFSGGRLRNARHWDWLGQALEAGFLRGQLDKSGATSKEQLLIERRQKLQGKTEPQVSSGDLPCSLMCIDCIH